MERRATIPEAATLLGISEEAVRSRIARKSLKKLKEAGKVWVLLPEDEKMKALSLDALRDTIRRQDAQIAFQQAQIVQLTSQLQAAQITVIKQQETITQLTQPRSLWERIVGHRKALPAGPKPE